MALGESAAIADVVAMACAELRDSGVVVSAASDVDVEHVEPLPGEGYATRGGFSFYEEDD